jgi:PAS domain S-box-containing protein
VAETPIQTVAPTKDELFSLIVESSRDFAIFTTDPNGICTSWNIGAQRLFGYSESDFVGRSADLLFLPDQMAAGIPDKERIQAVRDGKAIDERWHQRMDGSRFWASGLMMPLKEKVRGFVKITRDRTEQRRAEELLRENEERFRLLATNIPQLVFRTRPDGFRTWGSPQWIDFTGLNLEESLGMGWLDAVHPDDRDLTNQAWQKAVDHGEYYVEHRVRRARDQQYRWHQTRAKPINPSDKLAADWVGTMTDIHDLRGFQERQKVLLSELQHRTRNLLALVQSVARRTLRSSTDLKDFGSEFEGRLRALSRLQGLLTRAEDQEVDLYALVDAELTAHVDEKDTRLDRISVQGPHISIPGVTAQTLGLALHELATNAVKYGALSRPVGQLSVTWDVDQTEADRRLTLAWIERGVPINSGNTRKGYGSELIERALPYQLGAKTELSFAADGVHCSIMLPLPANVELSHA